jgi:hypothetical protein
LARHTGGRWKCPAVTSTGLFNVDCLAFGIVDRKVGNTIICRKINVILNMSFGKMKDIFVTFI